MNFDFSVPMTFYELLAIVLAALALVIPAFQWLYKLIFKHLKFDFIPSGKITLYFNKSGAYISCGGVYSAQNKPVAVEKIAAIISRDSDKAELELDWSTFHSSMYRDVGGKIEKSFETAHPFMVETGAFVPVFVEFEKSGQTMMSLVEQRIRDVHILANRILATESVTLNFADTQLKSYQEYRDAITDISDFFFWRSGSYHLELTTSYSGHTQIKRYGFSISEAESALLRSNIDNILVEPIANHFQLGLNYNTLQKEFVHSEK